MSATESAGEKRPLPSSPSSSTELKRSRFSPPPSSAGRADSAITGSSGNTKTPAESHSTQPIEHKMQPWHNLPAPISKMGLKPTLPDMPPSLEMIVGHQVDLAAKGGMVGQEEVGIIGYAGGERLKGVSGIIKQRFTDFLVYEVGLDGEILRLKEIGKPHDEHAEAVKKDKGKGRATEQSSVQPSGPKDPADEETATGDAASLERDVKLEDLPENLQFDSVPSWRPRVTLGLRDILSDETIIALHALFKEGKTPPLKSDGGWGQRPVRPESNGEDAAEGEESAMNIENGDAAAHSSNQVQGQGRDRGRGRGGRGARGGRGGRGGRQQGDDPWSARKRDEREVLSQPIGSKEARTAAHQKMRELFPSNLWETSSRQLAGESDQRLVIKYATAVHPQDKRKDRSAQKGLPNYIHFTLHKSNRDTQDCLINLGRMLGCHPKELSVAGTKDKRAVTVQRVCLKRSGKMLQQVWRSVNGVNFNRRKEGDVIKERGDRGTRIGDLQYSDKYLELGMLKGNHFVITLRNVQSDNVEEIDATLSSLRDRGFINFYGMQRFGTSTIPTHVIGLYILRGEWKKAIDALLSLREGEHPDCQRARLAWLEDGDVGQALQIMPRRCVAERSIWEFWRRGNRQEDMLGALGAIPRNLRTIYVHAYQSYIWNLAVAARVKKSATEPLVGDLVFDNVNEDEEAIEEEMNANRGHRAHATSSSHAVKRLTEADLPNHTIRDVVMPLPGFDVEYPGGDVGEMYSAILKADGLDPKRMRRDQRDYSLPGSYRKIIHRPSHVAWQHVRYSDHDTPFVQTDEDRILGLNPAAEDDPAGSMRAVVLELTLGSSSYATMALREVTREETSVWHQIGLTMSAEGRVGKGEGEVEEVENDADGEQGDDARTGADVAADEGEELVGEARVTA